MCKCIHLDLLLLVLSNGLSHYQFKICCCQRKLLAELSSLRKMLNIILKKVSSLQVSQINSKNYSSAQSGTSTTTSQS